MSTFTVAALSADEPRQWTSTKGGPMLSWKLKFEEHPDKIVEWSRKQSSGAPTVGQKVEGTIDWEHQYGPRFKQDFSQTGGGGGYRPRDPKETAAIQRQSCQRTAAMLELARAIAGNHTVTWEGFIKTRGALERDLGELETPYGQQPLVRKDIERTGQTDVPAESEQFAHPPATPVPGEDPIPFLREPEWDYEQVKGHASRW